MAVCRASAAGTQVPACMHVFSLHLRAGRFELDRKHPSLASRKIQTISSLIRLLIKKIFYGQKQTNVSYYHHFSRPICCVLLLLKSQHAAQFPPHFFCEQDWEYGGAWAWGPEEGEGKGSHLRGHASYGFLMPVQELEISFRPVYGERVNIP